MVLASLGESVRSGLVVVDALECAIDGTVLCALHDGTVVCVLDDGVVMNVLDDGLFLYFLLEVDFVDILRTTEVIVSGVLR